MIIVGIDFSISETGIAITGRDGNPAGMCVVRSPSVKGQSDSVRFHKHTDNIMEVLDKNAPQPKKTVIIIEDYAFAAPGQITRIAECCGILKHKLFIWGYPPDQLIAVAPSMLKKFVTGQGNAQKDLMLLMAYKRWGVQSNNNNEVDAFSLMQLGMLLKTDPANLTKYENELLVKMIATNKKNLGEMKWLSQLSSANLSQVQPKQPKPRKRKSSQSPESLKGQIVDVENLSMNITQTTKEPKLSTGVLRRRK